MGILPAAAGRRRYLKTKSELRKDCKHLLQENKHLRTQATLAITARDQYAEAVRRSVLRITTLEEEARANARAVSSLRSEATALRSTLANARAVSSLGATPRPTPQELAAAGRTTADTVELETLDERDMFNDTARGWKTPPALGDETTQELPTAAASLPQPVATRAEDDAHPHTTTVRPVVHTLAEAFTVHGARVHVHFPTAHAGPLTPEMP